MPPDDVVFFGVLEEVGLVHKGLNPLHGLGAEVGVVLMGLNKVFGALQEIVKPTSRFCSKLLTLLAL